MLRIDLRPLLALGAIGALLAVTGSAHAASANPPGAIVTDNKDPDKLLAGHRHDALVFSGDAYDNEMGITAGPSADGIIAVLIGL
jgi:hypothetical protein